MHLRCIMSTQQQQRTAYHYQKRSKFKVKISQFHTPPWSVICGPQLSINKQATVSMNMNHKENPKNFFHYWWFRYMMATELYIVEKWEQATIREYNNSPQHVYSIAEFVCNSFPLIIVDVILALMFAGLWYLNSTFLLAFVTRLMTSEPAAVDAQYPPVTSSLIVDSISPGGITS